MTTDEAGTKKQQPAELILLSAGYMTGKEQNSQRYQRMLLQQPITVVGRNRQKVDICLHTYDATSPDKVSFISQIHFTIFYDDETASYEIVDNGSSNRTYLDGEILEQNQYYPLKNDTVIRLGNHYKRGAILRFSTTPNTTGLTNKISLLDIEEQLEAIRHGADSRKSPPPSESARPKVIPHIFISYSSQDSVTMEFVKEKLEGHFKDRLRIWVDEVDIQIGSQWVKRIEESILGAKALLLIVSPNALRSDWVQKEILYAHSHHIPMMPVLVQSLDGHPPFVLMDTQLIDLPKNPKEGIQALITALEDKLK